MDNNYYPTPSHLQRCTFVCKTVGFLEWPYYENGHVIWNHVIYELFWMFMNFHEMTWWRLIGLP